MITIILAMITIIMAMIVMIAIIMAMIVMITIIMAMIVVLILYCSQVRSGSSDLYLAHQAHGIQVAEQCVWWSW